MLELLRLIHIGCATISISGFVVRGVGTMQAAPWLQHKLVRILPHVIDTLLLLSAIGMLSIYGFGFATQGWMVAKFIGLLIYIVAGTIALKRGKTRAVRLTAFVVAVSVFTYIVAVALTKSPWLT